MVRKRFALFAFKANNMVELIVLLSSEQYRRYNLESTKSPHISHSKFAVTDCSKYTYWNYANKFLYK